MISTKIGIQDFSKATQNHNYGDDTTVHYSAAMPTEKNADQSGNVGDVLNAVANPSGRDPNRQVRKAHNTLDKDDFLKLMLTQMKNQDPMNPMQSHEMAAQLAQFTSLEQLFNVNKNLESLQHAQDPMQKFEVLNFLGKTIKADTRQIMRVQGDQGSDLRFNLMGDTSKVKITIADETGATVKVLEYGGLKMGPNKVVWSGLNGKDQEVKPGKYIFNIEALNSSGKKVGVGTETAGTITGVNYTPEGPLLMVGDQKVRLQDVQKIEDDGLKNQQNVREELQLLNQQGQTAKPGDGAQKQALQAAGLKGGNQAVPQSVLDNLSRQLGLKYKAGQDNQPKEAAGNQGGAQRNEESSGAPTPAKKGEFIPFTPQALETEASKGPKVKPEDKPEPKLTGAILPLEVASNDAVGSSGINTGGAFGRK